MLFYPHDVARWVAGELIDATAGSYAGSGSPAPRDPGGAAAPLWPHWAEAAAQAESCLYPVLQH